MRKPLALFTSLLALAANVDCGKQAWTPEQADLLFTSNRDGNAEIYLQPAGSREWVNLSQHEAGDNWPVWSPDGERIAFQSRRSGNLDIWVMAADGSGQTRLTEDPEPDYLPAWAPDGGTIVFTSWRVEPGDSARAPHLYTMRPDGTGERRLVSVSLGTSAGASFAPDGKSIVYSKKAGDKGANLCIADESGGREHPITAGEDTYFGSPAFSPDGRWIACYAARDSASALVIMTTDGSQPRTLLETGHNWYPRWSPDGRWLVYTAAVDSARTDIDVFAMPVAGGAPQPLATGPGREQEASWRPR